MDWAPIGPSFVFGPKSTDFRRVSSRNAWGVQCKVESIAIAGSNPDVIYTTSRPWTGGAAAHRSDDGGKSWTLITGGTPTVDPCCIAVHPADPQYVVMGTFGDMGVYVSRDGGRSWGPKLAMTSVVMFLLIDPRPATPATCVVYAGTGAGLFRSTDGGATFGATAVVVGPICDLAADIPPTGTAHFYAGVLGNGLWHANDPSAAANWQNLSNGGLLPVASSMPAATTDYDLIQVALCPNTPGRAYAMMFYVPVDAAGNAQPHRSRALYTTSNPRGAWTRVAATELPDPGSDLYCCRIAAAPTSPGDGRTDVLFFCNTYLMRSTDGGVTWQLSDPIHADYHALAFFPPRAASGTRSVIFVGCDGGIGRSTGLTNPLYELTPTYFNQLAALNANDTAQNLNHGFRALSFGDFTTARGLTPIAYTAVADTGMAAFDGNQTWRNLAGADLGPVAAVQGTNGVTVWYGAGAYPDYPGWGRLTVRNDDGGFDNGSGRNVELRPGTSHMGCHGNMTVAADGNCYVGVEVRDVSGTIMTAVTAAGVATVTVSSATGISSRSTLVFTDEMVNVSGIVGTSVTATFTKTKAAGAAFSVQRNLVVRVGADGTANAASTDLLDDNRLITWIAAHPTDPNVVYAASSHIGDPPTTTSNLMVTRSASTATGSTAWTPIVNGDLHAALISSITVAPDGKAYVLLVSSALSSNNITVAARSSPLYEVSSGNWVSQPCMGVPAGVAFGYIVADPNDASTLYASAGTRVFRVRWGSGTWTWIDITGALPGFPIYKLEAIETDRSDSHVILRVAGPTSCVWERDAADITETTPRLFLRNNLLDLGYNRAPSGVANPFRPSELMWHYVSPDVVLDAQQHEGGTSWHQIDPEGSTLPISAVTFGQLRDNSQALPGLNPAYVHVQVHNRSDVPADNVKVWALVASASAGLPSLFRSDSAGNAFAFWDQFDPTGNITPSLPSDSPWRAVGPPITLPRISAGEPRVASWRWDVPLPPTPEPLHYCVAVFVHSAASPLPAMDGSLDTAAATHPQVAQKNLHIMPVLIGGG